MWKIGQGDRIWKPKEKILRYSICYSMKYCADTICLPCLIFTMKQNDFKQNSAMTDEFGLRWAKVVVLNPNSIVTAILCFYLVY